MEWRNKMDKSLIKVLVVEDDKFAQMVARNLGQQLNCSIDIASTATEALEKTNINKYALIFMDIGLGETDGFTVTRAIKANSLNQETPIIALTAHNSEEYLKQAALSGMAKFITKPLLKDKVLELLNTYALRPMEV